MGSPLRPAARPAMEEEEEAIGYLDKVLEDEDDSEPGTPTSPVSPFSAGEKVGSGCGDKGHLSGAGDVQVLEQLPGPCGGCWRGAELAAAGASLRCHHTPRTACGQGHGVGLCWAPGVEGSERGDHHSGVTTQLSFQGGVEPHVLRGGSCVAQQSQHRMLRKGLVSHSAPLLSHQKLLNSPKTELGGRPGETPVLAGAAQHPSHAHPARVPVCWKRALALLFLGSLAWGSHKGLSHCSGSQGSS